MATDRAAPAPHRSPGEHRARLTTLHTAFAEFWRHPSPWLIAVSLAGAVVARASLGHWQWTDGLVLIVLLALSPLIEWLIHVGVLHWRPRQIAGLTVDWMLPRDHRRHHRDPRDLPLIFIPWPVLVGLLPTLAGIALLAPGRIELSLTFLVTVTAFLLSYEWTHYLIHTDYKPRHRPYRAVYRNHRYHHFKSEHYWFTVTTAGTADRVLGTHPDPAAVATSQTARNLHGIG